MLLFDHATEETNEAEEWVVVDKEGTLTLAASMKILFLLQEHVFSQTPMIMCRRKLSLAEQFLLSMKKSMEARGFGSAKKEERSGFIYLVGTKESKDSC